MTLGWSPVPYAAELPLLARERPRAREPRRSDNGQPVETWATNYVPAFNLLPSGTYYWDVTPGRLRGQQGTPSPVSSFTLVLAVDDDACT